MPLISESAVCFLLCPAAAPDPTEPQVYIDAIDLSFSPLMGEARVGATEQLLRDFLDRAHVAPNQIDAVFCSISSGEELEWVEIHSLHRIFGNQSRICSVRGSLGDCFGVSGGIQVAVAAQALKKQLLPPTRCLHHWSASCFPKLNIARDSAFCSLNRILVHSLDPDGFIGNVILSRIPVGRNYA
jgi:3-oxoacyl-(acyl-carrier-protein) synthase